MHTLVEICIDDLDGALVAERAGADRVELCGNLIEGGTTPSIGLLRRVLDSVERIGVQVMVRPRGGNFVNSASELSVMQADIRAIRRDADGAAVRVGLVLGVLTRDNQIDQTAMRRLIAEAAELPVTFHKAFDDVNDLGAALEQLGELGVERVLTSGGQTTAFDGAGALRDLGRHGSAVRILAGGGVRAHNVAALVASTGVSEVHLRAQVASPLGTGTLATDFDIIRSVIGALARSN
ncbi:copper homeostasis protein [Cryobacterium flavum]|uniref:PF03932 family protein CutC n=1 Tax=Cryobacterium flavum TaxID=1424659 RepID=A0A4R8VET9_9MICO|nr:MULTISPECIES: copper homeostasis protein CutC [Cryobacterium]TFB81056.1 copper homeostasis protein CutC [Cryobacterium flavum]SDM78451.1 copper homeostasis protein [Cryobacterium flavum]